MEVDARVAGAVPGTALLLGAAARSLADSVVDGVTQKDGTTLRFPESGLGFA